ncbi:MAG: ATP-dependent Clp protease ATP-binding subunit [Bacteroidales bacterium]|nr:ATP-dependent Clp protease ATP-binding subunit [Bacteroidales bacterium]
MDAKFSQRTRDVLSYSREEAIRLGNPQIGVEHLFLGLLRNGEGEAIDALKALNVSLYDVRKAIENKIRPENAENLGSEANLPLTKAAEKALKLVYLEARSFKSYTIETGHLLLAILKDDTSLISQILSEFNADYFSVREILEKAEKPEESMEELESGKSPRLSIEDEEEGDEEELTSPSDSDRQKDISATTRSATDTPVLDNFGTDLTQAAEEGRLDPVVGREIEIERLAQILSRRKKNNPILIGEPGVGKSAVVEGLALRITQKKVSRILYNKRVVTLDLASIVAGTKYRGQFEERMKAVLGELTKHKDIILFIDEIHTIVGAGGASGSLDAANMLKPALARGEIQCIGATTLNEYRQHIEKDGALERRFQKVLISPSSVEESIRILKVIKEKYEEHHNVTYTPDAIEACVRLTQRYISDRNLPDKAIDAMDEAGARAHIRNIVVPEKIENLESKIDEIKQAKIAAVKNQKFEEAAKLRDQEKSLTEKLEKEKSVWSKELYKNRVTVNADKVAEIVAMMTGVPVQRIAQTEGSRLLNMSQVIKESIIGQDEAIDKIVKAIQRNRAGLRDPNKPIGTFIFLGPTGVGKTQLAKVLAKYLFQSADNFIRVDMSEYMEKFSVSRLVGAPPGYVGYEEGGQLTEKVRRHPYSVVLLDEIEKAHPDVFHLLLQVLDEGQLTDSLGRRVDFRNTILIMTSNIGSRRLSDFGQGIGFSTKARDAQKQSNTKKTVQNELKKSFAPEFLNRIDDVVLFNNLGIEEIKKIVLLEIKALKDRILDSGCQIRISHAAANFIAEKGYDASFGARPLKRAIQTYLEDPMAEAILEGNLVPGTVIHVGYQVKKGELSFKITTK